MKDIDKHFSMLEVDRESSADIVKQAYKDLAQIWHPDRFANNPRLADKAEEKMKELNYAYKNVMEFISSNRQEISQDDDLDDIDTRTTPELIIYFLNEMGSKDFMHIGSDIPKEKLENALQNIDLPTHETPFALFDLTVLGTAENCLVFSENGIYYRNGWKSAQSGSDSIPYAQFKFRTFKPGNLFKGWLELSLGNDQWLDTSSCEDSKFVLGVLNGIKKMIELKVIKT